MENKKRCPYHQEGEHGGQCYLEKGHKVPEHKAVNGGTPQPKPADWIDWSQNG